MNGNKPLSPPTINGTPQFPYVLGVPSSAIKPGTIVLGKWDTWPYALTGAVEKLGGITASNISIPGTLAEAAAQWGGPNAKLPTYVRNLYASGNPLSNGAGVGIYMMEMAVANGYSTIFDVSNVNLALVNAHGPNYAAALSKISNQIDPRATILNGKGQPAYPALHEKYLPLITQRNALVALHNQTLPLTETELLHVLQNPSTFQNKLQFYKNGSLVTWSQVFAK